MLAKLEQRFEANRNEANALHMGKYMKNHFPFLGIKTPYIIRSLWEKDEREYQYAALHYLERSLKKLGKNDLALMEYLITTKSWWDTVDMLAQKPVGKIAKDHPEVIAKVIEGWAIDENLWLRRTAILFQLKYKTNTNEALLYRIIQHNAASDAFFIQKAIGWALREYSKTNSASVKNFIATTNLAKLSIREGSKYLD